MNILERYAHHLEHSPETVAELFASDGYFYDGGMKLIGRDKCHFAGREEIHANFTQSGRIPVKVANILINANAMRYNVLFKDVWIEALGVAVVNSEGLLQSFVTQCIDFRQKK